MSAIGTEHDHASIDLNGTPYEVVYLEGREGLSQLFKFDVTYASTGRDPAPKSMIGSPAVITPSIETVLASDHRLPPSAPRLRAAMEAEWPHLAERVSLDQHDFRDVEVRPDDIVVCVHGCGSLTDRVMDRAIEVGADLAVLPCCSDHSRLDTGGLHGWLGGDLAIDVTRVVRLRAEGYKVWTLHIDEDITPKNRLLMGRRADTA